MSKSQFNLLGSFDSHIAQNIAETYVRNISNLSLQLKYYRNIFVKYCKIFHCNITILTFWNIFVNK